MKLDRRALLGAIPLLIIPGIALSRPPGRPGSNGAKPKIVLIERHPWLMAIGSDSPTFALYENGRAIYATAKGYRSLVLAEREMAVLLEEIGATTLPKLAKHYDTAPLVSDQPTEILAIFENAEPSIISVYGSIGRTPRPGSVVPPAIITAYNRLKSFTHPNATDWMPEKIEVMIWPYEYAPDKSIIWPAGWPGLDDADTVSRREGSYSLFLPASELSKLKGFLATRHEKGAVEIGGKKWAAAWRLPFPMEQRWMNPAKGIGIDVE